MKGKWEMDGTGVLTQTHARHDWTQFGEFHPLNSAFGVSFDTLFSKYNIKMRSGNVVIGKNKICKFVNRVSSWEIALLKIACAFAHINSKIQLNFIRFNSFSMLHLTLCFPKYSIREK